MIFVLLFLIRLHLKWSFLSMTRITNCFLQDLELLFKFLIFCLQSLLLLILIAVINCLSLFGIFNYADRPFAFPYFLFKLLELNLHLLKLIMKLIFILLQIGVFFVNLQKHLHLFLIVQSIKGIWFAWRLPCIHFCTHSSFPHNRFLRLLLEVTCYVHVFFVLIVLQVHFGNIKQIWFIPFQIHRHS